jgi:hypothetical protein
VGAKILVTKEDEEAEEMEETRKPVKQGKGGNRYELALRTHPLSPPLCYRKEGELS